MQPFAFQWDNRNVKPLEWWYDQGYVCPSFKEALDAMEYLVSKGKVNHPIAIWKVKEIK